MIVLDTTVLVYAVGSEHELRKPCRTLIEAIADGRVIGTTTIEVIQEFTHVRARRRDRSDATELARDFVELLSPLLIVEESDLREGLRIYAEHRHLGCFDSILAAAAHAAGADAIVSADAAFAELTNVAHVFPDEDGIGRLLSDTEREQ